MFADLCKYYVNESMWLRFSASGGGADQLRLFTILNTALYKINSLPKPSIFYDALFHLLKLQHLIIEDLRHAHTCSVCPKLDLGWSSRKYSSLNFDLRR